MRQELVNVERPQLARMPPMVERHVGSDPAQALLLRAVGLMPGAHLVPRHRATPLSFPAAQPVYLPESVNDIRDLQQAPAA